MKRSTLFFLAALFLSGVATAQSDQVEEAILNAHNAWFAAFDRGDVDAIDRMETDDFVLVNRDRIVDKRQQLENIRTGLGGGTEMTRVTGVHSFSLIGDAAVLTGLAYSSSQAGGESFLFSEVWVQREGRWQIRLAHFSSVGAEP